MHVNKIRADRNQDVVDWGFGWFGSLRVGEGVVVGRGSSALPVARGRRLAAGSRPGVGSAARPRRLGASVPHGQVAMRLEGTDVHRCAGEQLRVGGAVRGRSG